MEEKQHGKWRVLLWGILVVVIIIAVLYLLNFMGVPVGKNAQALANKIPVVNKLIPDPSTQKTASSDNQYDWNEKYLKSSAQVKEKDQEISDLTKQLDAVKKQLEDMKTQNQDLQNKLGASQSKTAQNQAKQLSSMYANIPATKAAAMIESMPLEDAALTISQLNSNLQSSILGGMKDAKKAAQITLLVKEIAGLTDTDPAALKDQIHQIALQQEDPTQTLADTMAGMPAAQAAGMIQSMMGTNSQMAMELLKDMNTDNRSQILTQIENKDAKMAAQIAAGLNQ